MSAALDFTYRYAHPSGVTDEAGKKGVTLATCGAAHEHPHFFEGRLLHPKFVGDMLVALSDVVRTHYFLPRPMLLDPVVTSNDEMLRFEGFSGCCGVYARVDLPASTLASDIHGRGTTNVDFNDPMRAALTRMSDSEEVRLAVGKDAVTLERSAEAVVEKRVKLPLRWLKGFSEVQAYLPRMHPVGEVAGAEARRFLRSLPLANPPKRPTFIVPAGRGLRMTTREQAGAVRVLGLHRLRALAGLAPRARRLRVWHDADAGTSGWEIEHDAGWFFLMLSPEVYRGFSGEGQVLESLASARGERSLSLVRAQLNWQNSIDVGSVAGGTGLAGGEVEGALLALGSQGLAGYDARTGMYFHRELPFDLAQVESLQPRLQGARRLVESGGVHRVERRGAEAWDAAVAGTDVVHTVRLRASGDRCTCPWFSKHQGARGPCKHVLAARLVAAPDPEDVAAPDPEDVAAPDREDVAAPDPEDVAAPDPEDPTA